MFELERRDVRKRRLEVFQSSVGTLAWVRI